LKVDNGIYRGYTNKELMQFLSAKEGKSAIIDTLVLRLEKLDTAYEELNALVQMEENKPKPLITCPICEASLINKMEEDDVL
jgi:hypothetical protein